jgi:hypothetical protein
VSLAVEATAAAIYVRFRFAAMPAISASVMLSTSAISCLWCPWGIQFILVDVVHLQLVPVANVALLLLPETVMNTPNREDESEKNVKANRDAQVVDHYGFGVLCVFWIAYLGVSAKSAAADTPKTVRILTEFVVEEGIWKGRQVISFSVIDFECLSL